MIICARKAPGMRKAAIIAPPSPAASLRRTRARAAIAAISPPMAAGKTMISEAASPLTANLPLTAEMKKTLTATRKMAAISAMTSLLPRSLLSSAAIGPPLISLPPRPSPPHPVRSGRRSPGRTHISRRKTCCPAAIPSAKPSRAAGILKSCWWPRAICLALPGKLWPWPGSGIFPCR